ncbi:unnamed protein product, partial [Ectocarpus sp. 4 AP-2014]
MMGEKKKKKSRSQHKQVLFVLFFALITIWNIHHRQMNATTLLFVLLKLFLVGYVRLVFLPWPPSSSVRNISLYPFSHLRPTLPSLQLYSCLVSFEVIPPAPMSHSPPDRLSFLMQKESH